MNDGKDNENPTAGSSAGPDGVRRGRFGDGYWSVIPDDPRDRECARVVESLVNYLYQRDFSILTSYDTSGFPYDPDCAIDIDLTG